MDVIPLPDRVLVTDMYSGERMVNSILLVNDNGTSSGIRPRWAKVWKVGEKITEVVPGEWVLLRHGRWSRASIVDLQDGNEPVTFWMIDYPDGVLVVSESPEGDTFQGASTVVAEKLKR